jgi:hypothetical protein
MRAHERLERSQKKLYRTLKSELAYLDEAGKAIVAYERSFRLSLPKRVASSSKKELLRAISSAKVVLVGDFHSFRQSQKGFLRILAESGYENAGVALECIQQSMQPLLESYLAGNLTAEELREDLSFDREWPFPWPNYREILELCRRKNLPLFALNIQKKNSSPEMLKERDNAAASRISELLSAGIVGKIFVLYGELHLGRRHLPVAIRRLLPRSEKVVVIHQNEPSLYWKAPRKPGGQRPEILRLRRDEFCILNSVPWVRLQSYLDWLEGGGEENWQEGTDTAGSTLQLAKLLGNTLEINSSFPEDLETLGPEALNAGSPSALKGLSNEERIILRHALEFGRTALLAKKGALLVPALSTNALTEAASLLLWRARRKGKQKNAYASGTGLLLQFAIGYLGSKILNPKRKCNEVADMKDYLRRRSAASTGKGRVFRRCLTLLEPYLADAGPCSSRPLPGILEVEAHRLAGYVLANRLFLALLKDPSPLPFAAKVFTSSGASQAWARHTLLEISRKIREQKVAPISKSEAF